MRTTNGMDRLHSWIAFDKPSFKDLIQNEYHAYIVFSTLVRMNARNPMSHVTELIY
jgi:hypothetical protein